MDDLSIALIDVVKLTQADEASELVKTFSVFREDKGENQRKIRIEIWKGIGGYVVNSWDEENPEVRGSSGVATPTPRDALIALRWRQYYDEPVVQPMTFPSGVVEPA